jgi:KAP family P-loop domain
MSKAPEGMLPLTAGAKKIVERANEIAKNVGMFPSNGAALLLAIFEFGPKKLISFIYTYIADIESAKEKAMSFVAPKDKIVLITDSDVMWQANIDAKDLKYAKINPDHILLAFMKGKFKKLFDEVIGTNKLTFKAVENYILNKKGGSQSKKKAKNITNAQKIPESRIEQTAQTIPEPEVDAPRLGEVCKELGLEVDDNQEKINSYAWAIQQHRSSAGSSNAKLNTFITRPSLFYSLCLIEPDILVTAEKAGLQSYAFKEALTVSTFDHKSVTNIDFDLPLHGGVVAAIKLFKDEFPGKNRINAFGLAYGILALKGSSKVRNLLTFIRIDVDDALKRLRKIIEGSPIDIPPKPDIEESQAGDPPTSCVHQDMWTINDLLGYDLYAKSIEEFIKHENTKPPLVIGIQAPWGQGKTSLMRMVQKRIDPNHPDLNEKKEESTDDLQTGKGLRYKDLRNIIETGKVDLNLQKLDYPSVWFNAWKYESSEQVWAGMAHSILNQLTSRLKDEIEREKFWLMLKIKRIDKNKLRNEIHHKIFTFFLPRLANWLGWLLAFLIVAGIALFGIISGLLNSDFAGLIGKIVSGGAGALAIAKSVHNWIKSKNEVMEETLDGVYRELVQEPDYASKMGYLHLVEEDMKRVFDLLIDNNKPAIVFVDDLDRCSPVKVGKVIEAINLFLAGNYRGCVFVLGIDAQIVAAAMEVVHKDIIEKLADRKDELGWCFMDKIVQLPFVIPRLSDTQREDYLRNLLRIRLQKEKTDDEQKEHDENKQKLSDLASDLKAKKKTTDEIIIEFEELDLEAEYAQEEELKEVQEAFVEDKTSKFNDKDENLIKEIEGLLEYLSDNPRTVKLFVNLYRFQLFMSYARQVSVPKMKSADEKQIAHWVLMIIRWPHFVRWMQKNMNKMYSENSTTVPLIQEIVKRAKSSPDAEKWGESLQKIGIRPSSWCKDRDLRRFLIEKVSDDNDLGLTQACEYGLW